MGPPPPPNQNRFLNVCYSIFIVQYCVTQFYLLNYLQHFLCHFNFAAKILPFSQLFKQDRACSLYKKKTAAAAAAAAAAAPAA